MYDEKHRLHVLSALEGQKDRMAQSGLWERMLCAPCETKMSRWERYARHALEGGIELTYERNRDFVYVSNLDYSKFRLFQLSVLWKAHASRLPFFKKVELGKHAELIRNLLLDEQPGRHCRYGCLMFGLRFEGRAFSGVIMQPTIQRLKGHRAYRFVFGGFLWCYLVSSQDVSPPLSAGILQPSGKLAFLVRDATDFPDLKSFATTWQELGRAG